VTNGLPALALGVDPPDATQMSEPPRKASSSLLTSREYLGMAFVGVWMGAAALLCQVWPWGQMGSDALVEERAAAFSLLALSPLFHAFNCRSPIASIAALRPMVSRALVIAVVVSAAIHLLAVLVPALRPVFRTFPMDLREWLLVLVLSASILPAIEGLKLLQRRGLFAATLEPLSRRSLR